MPALPQLKERRSHPDPMHGMGLPAPVLLKVYPDTAFLRTFNDSGDKLHST